MKVRITRRNFLKTMGTAAVTVSAMGMLTACGGGDGTPSNSTGGNTSGSGGNSGETPDNPSGGDNQDEVIETNWLYFPKGDGTATISGYNGTLEANVVVPEKIGRYSIVTIGGMARSNTMVTLTLPASIKTVYTYGFEFCKSLEHIYLSEGLETIMACAFQGCSALREINLPNSVKSIELGAFRDCKKAKVLSIPSKLDYISIDAFRNTAIEEVTIPASVTLVDGMAFADNRNLQTVRFLGKTKFSSENDQNGYQFSGCESLEDIVLPDETEKIEEGMFSSCYSLKGFQFPSKLKTIEDMAFMSSGLTAALLPAGVTKIGEDAFAHSQLIVISLPQGLKEIGASAFEFTNLVTAAIPEGIKEIQESTFANCRDLKSVYLPASVRSIEKSAFESCNFLQNVYYGGSAENWKQIKIAGKNEALEQAELHENASPAQMPQIF